MRSEVGRASASMLRLAIQAESAISTVPSSTVSVPCSRFAGQKRSALSTLLYSTPSTSWKKLFSLGTVTVFRLSVKVPTASISVTDVGSVMLRRL